MIQPGRNIAMTEFRLTQISDTHLARRFPRLTANFESVCDHLDATRPDLVLNTGDMACDSPAHPDDLEYARALHETLPVPCRCLPGNHDLGDNPTQSGPRPSHPVSEQSRQTYIAAFGDDRWRFDAAGWCFVGLNSLLMNSGLVSEAEQFDWLASELASVNGKPVALFLHKPVYLNTPEDPEIETSAIRYVPPQPRRRLVEMLGKVDVRLIGSGHVHQRRDFTWRGVRNIWSPSSAFVIADKRQERIALKEVGLVEYRFAPDSFEVRHVRAPGQVDVDLDELLAAPARVEETAG
jgi:3',5'-cyclic AMP phosphodiesterase CpdA